MINNKNIWGMWLILISLCSSCIDDPGNYEYLDKDVVMPVIIAGLEDSYSLEVLGHLQLTPEITGLDDEKNYSFTWYITSDLTYIKVWDTVALTRNLDASFDCEAGKYSLIYEIRDKRTDLYVNKKMEVAFSSNFGHGWYVLKDENNQTDLDFVLPDGTVKADVFSRIHRHKMKGTAVKMAYQGSSYCHEVENSDGTVSVIRVPAIFIFSSEDLNVLNAADLTLYKNQKDFFYDESIKSAPQNFTVSNRDLAFVNDGKLFLLYGMARNVGKMGLPLIGDYELSSGMICDRSKGAMIFDRKSHSFLYSKTYATSVLSKFPDKKVTGMETKAVSPTQMNADLIALLPRVEVVLSVKTTAYALMRKLGEDNEYYLADIAFDGQYPFVRFDTLPEAYQVAKANVWAAHQVASCIYFATGNVLKAHIVTGDNSLPVEVREKELKTFEGESITYVSHIKSVNPKDKFDHLVVLTNSAAGWKLYRFELKGSTYEINNPDAPHFASGGGTARYVMFRI